MKISGCNHVWCFKNCVGSKLKKKLMFLRKLHQLLQVFTRNIIKFGQNMSILFQERVINIVSSEDILLPYCFDYLKTYAKHKNDKNV